VRPLPGGGGGYGQRGLSLLHGWLPWTVQAVVLVLLLVVVGWRTRRFRLLGLPVCVLVGAGVAAGALLLFSGSGLASDPAPQQLWWWVGVTGAALALVVVGWAGARWWRRILSLLVLPLCLLCVGLVLNQWVGYFSTVGEAWSQLTAAPLPNQVPADGLAALRGTVRPTDPGRVVAVSIPDTASGFAHRTEDVWLPPAWFAGPRPPALPVIMMIGGEFNTPADWIRTGNVLPVVDAYAAAHGGQAPILVFVDAGGTFNNDTECVDGPRGNAADHLTGDVRPYVIAHFGASPDPRQWGVVGWSMGGTCAVDLAVMHPELFDTFDDIAGDAGPEVGTKDQTIARLYGGDAAAWARFDPATVLAAHAPYADTAGWFDDSSSPGRTGRPPAAAGRWRPGNGQAGGNGPGIGGRDGGGQPTDELAAARDLCTQAATRGIACTVRTQPGGHTWQFAGAAFRDALPWLAARLSDPGAPPSVS
jgi:S-formylglutathione hydrolase FrmB